MSKASMPLAPVIRRVCKELEKEKDVRILFAIENGSRAWRMESVDSDYDVRFVYVRPLEHYISLRKARDVIERSYDERGRISDDVIIDLVGFDIFKFLGLLSRSNPTMLEWIMSDIVYVGQRSPALKKFAETQVNPLALYHHYKSLCRKNYEKYIASGGQVSCKKYLYVYRGLINALYVVRHAKVPPIEILEALEHIDIAARIKEKIRLIIKIKKSGRELGQVKRIRYLDAQVESFLRTQHAVEPKKSDVDILNQELKRIVLK